MSSLTADQWCMLAITELRPIFKDRGWPLPDRIRAKQIYHWNSKWTHVIPAVDQDDGFAIIRYPASHSHAERVIPALLAGLYRLALSERGRKGPVVSLDFGRGRTSFLRGHIGLTDDNDELTRFGVAILRKIVGKIGTFPEGSSHPKPARRYKPTTFDVACSLCGHVWFRMNRNQYENMIVFGNYHCLLPDCGAALTARDIPDDEGNVFRMDGGL